MSTPPYPPSSWAQRAHAQAAYDAAARRAAQKRARRANLAPRAADAGIVFVLLAVAALTHGPVYGNAVGYIAALAGVTIGTVIALVTVYFRVGALGSFLAVFGAYMLLGGPIALPATTRFAVIPTLRTLQMLILGIAGTWKDLLTVQPPAGSFVGPAILPYLSALVLSFLAIRLALKKRYQTWALLPAFALMGIGIAWGSQSAPFAPILGLAAALIAVAWAALVSARNRKDGGRSTVEFASAATNPKKGRIFGAISMLLIAAVTSIGLTSYVLDGTHRAVLRDHVEPPLRLHEYASPASLFRTLNTTDKDVELFTVVGLPEGGRIHLATLDLYDGTVAQIAGDARGAGFRHVGSVFTDTPLPDNAQTATMTFEIHKWTNYWIPGGGTMRGLAFTSERAKELGSTLYYSDRLGTALSTTPVTEGDRYTVEVVQSRNWEDAELTGRPFMAVSLPANSQIPDSVDEVAATLTADAPGGVELVRTLQQKLHDDGFYSDGSDQLSPPGHRTSRIEQFLTADQLIGDDDQYAVSMALMLHSLGVPARVVMGFYPEHPTSGPVTITGKDTHLWVEVPFEGAGWVRFDPTPPRDQIPQTEVPKPKPNPKPQVLQPPDPPEEPAELPPDEVDEPDDDEKDRAPWIGWLLTAATWIASVTLLLSPVWLLLVIKAMRTSRRKKRGTVNIRTAGAWDDVIDHAADLGVVVPVASTRRDQAQKIEAKLTGQSASEGLPFRRFDETSNVVVGMAGMLDSAVFGAKGADDQAMAAAWQARNEAIAWIRDRLPWYRRFFAAVSIRSLRLRRKSIRQRLAAFVRAKDSAIEEESVPWNSSVEKLQPLGKGQ